MRRKLPEGVHAFRARVQFPGLPLTLLVRVSQPYFVIGISQFSSVRAPGS